MAKIDEKSQSKVPNDWKIVNDFVEKIYIKFGIRDAILNSQLGSKNEEIILKIDLRKFQNDTKDLDLIHDLRVLFKKNPSNTDIEIRRRIKNLYNQPLSNGIVGNNKIDLRKQKIRSRNIHLIYQNLDDFIFLKKRDSIQKDVSRRVAKFIKFIDYFGDFMLQKETYAKKIVYKCLSCFSEITVKQKPFEDLRFPDGCIRPKCSNHNKTTKKYYEELQDKSKIREIRTFNLIDDNQNTIKCVIFSGCDYFDKVIKNKNIQTRQLIEVIGILWTYKDEKDLKNRRKYYIEVNNLKPATEIFEIDETIIKEIKYRLSLDNTYFEKIIDDTNPLTRGIYEFLIVKELNTFLYETSDSWDEKAKFRQSLNAIYGGPPGNYKSSTIRMFQEIVGANNFGSLKGGDITDAGLVPTTQRTDKDMVRRLGALSYYNRKVLFIDEAQDMKTKARRDLKHLEDGFIPKSSDGEIINAPCKLSVGLGMNLMSIDNLYDTSKTLCENINFPEDEKAILERFDCFYAIPEQTPLTEKVIFERLMRGGVERNIPVNYIFNYMTEIKRIYSEGITDSPELIETFRKLYYSFLKRGSKAKLKSREINSLRKIIRAVAGLRLKSVSDVSDLEYVRKHLLHIMIPLRGSKIFLKKERTIDIEEVYMRTLILLMELSDFIFIEEHINEIRIFLQNHYFSEDAGGWLEEVLTQQKIENRLNPEINEYMPSDTGLNLNTKYRTILEKKETNDFINSNGFIVKVYKKKTCFVKTEYIDKILEKIRQLIIASNYEPVELKEITDGLDLIFNKALVRGVINEAVKNEVLKITKEKKIFIEK